MRNITLFFVLVASLSFVSCDKEQHNGNKTTVDTFPLTVTLSKSSLVEGSFELDSQSQSLSVTSSSATRIGHESGANIFVEGDDIGLYAVEYTGAFGTPEVKGALESSGNIINNHKYSYTSSKTWTAAALTNPLTWRSVSLYAYHPYSAVVTTDAKALTFTQRENQGTPIISSSDYLMYGSGSLNSTGYKPTAEGATINFSHKTAVVKLDVTLGKLYTDKDIISVDKATVLSVPKVAIMNLEDGEVTYSKGADSKLITVDVVMEKTDGVTALSATFEAVVLPTTYTVGAPVIKIDYTNADGAGAFYLDATTAVSELNAQSIYVFSATQAPDFCFATELLDVAAAGTVSSTFVVRSSDLAVNWTVTSGDDSWITVSKTDGSGWANSITRGIISTNIDINAYVKIEPNTDIQPRLGKLILSDTPVSDGEVEAGKYIELLINQAGAVK